MTSTVDIINRALSAIAAEATIANLFEQSSEAKLARLLYNSTRDALLRAAHWDFARMTIYATLLKAAPGTPENTTGSGPWNPATMPARPWLYEYAYPSDCQMIRYVTFSPQFNGSISPPMFSTPLPGNSPTTQIPKFKYEKAAARDGSGNLITVVNTNVQAAVLCYTVTVENEGLWDSLFQEAMVQSLATQFAMPITGKVEIEAQRAAQATQAIKTARARDGNEGTTAIDSIPDWLLVRGVSADWIAGDNYVSAWETPSFLAS